MTTSASTPLPQTFEIETAIHAAPQFLDFLGIGVTESSRTLEFIAGQIILSHRSSIYEELPGLLGMFILQREDDGSFLFSDTGATTFGLGASFRDAFMDWIESAIELKEMYSEEKNILSPGVLVTLGLLERVLERS